MAVATAQLAGNNTYALKCPDCGDYYVQKVFGGYQCTKGHVWEHPDINAVCCQKKDEVIRGLAERCAGQSELLSKKAEKPKFIGDPRFHAILKEMGDLHDERQQGYGTKNDPLANVRASEAWGIPAWMGAMIRGCDKIRRLQTYAETGHLNGEKVEDAFLDLANYAVIALVLWREQNEDKPCTT